MVVFEYNPYRRAQGAGVAELWLNRHYFNNKLIESMFDDAGHLNQDVIGRLNNIVKDDGGTLYSTFNGVVSLSFNDDLLGIAFANKVLQGGHI